MGYGLVYEKKNLLSLIGHTQHSSIISILNFHMGMGCECCEGD